MGYIFHIHLDYSPSINFARGRCICNHRSFFVPSLLSGIISFCTLSSYLSRTLHLQSYKIPPGSFIEFPSIFHYWLLSYKTVLGKS